MLKNPFGISKKDPSNKNPEGIVIKMLIIKIIAAYTSKRLNILKLAINEMLLTSKITAEIRSIWEGMGILAPSKSSINPKIISNPPSIFTIIIFLNTRVF